MKKTNKFILPIKNKKLKLIDEFLVVQLNNQSSFDKTSILLSFLFDLNVCTKYFQQAIG